MWNKILPYTALEIISWRSSCVCFTNSLCSSIHLFYDVQYGVLLYLQLFAGGGVAQPQMQCKNGLKQFNGCMLHVYLWYKNDFLWDCHFIS
jgi:hypothetical protein